jgi:hypothetical protein
MPIRFSCAQCGKSLQAPDHLAGKRVKCLSCNAIVTAPGGVQTVTAVPARVVVEAKPTEEPKRPAMVQAKRVQESEEIVDMDPDDQPRDDEESDDDRPRRERPRRKKKRRRSSSSGKGTKIALILGVAAFFILLIAVGGGFAAWYFFRHGGGGDSLDAEMVYLPDQCESLAVIQYDAVRSSPMYAELGKTAEGKKDFEFSKTPGGKELDVVRAVLAKASSGNYEVAVLTMRSKVTIQDVTDSGAEIAESKESGKTMYTVKDKSYFIDGKKVVISSSDGIRLLLRRPAEAQFTEGMKKAVKSADFKKPVVIMMAFDSTTQLNNDVQNILNALRQSLPQAMVAEADLSVPTNVSMRFYCKDAASANNIAQMMKNPAGAKGMGANFEDIVVEVNDAVITMRGKVKPSKFAGFMKP